MRIIDCDCGETLQAGNDEDLASIVKQHFADEHSEQLDDGAVSNLIDSKAYSATDA